MGKTCCPSGYKFNAATGLCESTTPLPPVPGCMCTHNEVHLNTAGSTGSYTFTGTDCSGNPISFVLAIGQTRDICAQTFLTQTPNPGGSGSFGSSSTRSGSCYNNNGVISCYGNTTTVTTAPIDCPCCPKGYDYVDQNGNFTVTDPSSPLYGTSGVISNPVPWASNIVGTCVTIVNIHWALPAVGVDPIDCPCCPEATWYDNQAGLCIDARLGRHDPIPCITCTCPDPPPPPECPSCTSSSPHVSFIYDFGQRTCTSCKPGDGELPKGKIQSFVANYLLNPVIRFKLP